ncbi:MAG: hypothetical protein IKK66_08330 [Ruminococcus sp.]|nr:hypothetical protein [Ruminococcus sp.]
MKLKRLFATVLATVMTFSSITAINSSSTSTFPTINDSEEYQGRIKGYERKQLLTEQETEYFKNILSRENITKVWRWNKPTTDTSDNYFLFDEYTYEIQLKDYLKVKLDLPREYSETIINELENTLGYNNYIKEIKDTDTYDCADISISFESSDHKMNYMIAEKAMSILSEKYPISDKMLQIDAVNHIPHIQLQSCFTYIDGKSHMDLTEQEFKEFYDSIDHDYIAENFRATYNPEIHRIEFPDDYTQEEKLGCFSYFIDNHNTVIHQYSNALRMSPISAIAEFDTEINYLNGDANCDQKYTIADSTAILQALGNPDKYGLSTQGLFNADSTGDGLTVEDAVAIKTSLAKGIE